MDRLKYGDETLTPNPTPTPTPKPTPTPEPKPKPAPTPEQERHALLEERSRALARRLSEAGVDADAITGSVQAATAAQAFAELNTKHRPPEGWPRTVQYTNQVRVRVRVRVWVRVRGSAWVGAQVRVWVSVWVRV